MKNIEDGLEINIDIKKYLLKLKTMPARQKAGFMVSAVFVLCGFLAVKLDPSDKPARPSYNSFVDLATPKIKKSELCVKTIEYVSASPNKNKDKYVTLKNSEFIRVNQTRFSDGKKFYYDCKFRGNRIIWRMNRIDGGMGRWRDGEYDPVIRYSSVDGSLNIYNKY